MTAKTPKGPGISRTLPGASAVVGSGGDLRGTPPARTVVADASTCGTLASARAATATGTGDDAATDALPKDVHFTLVEAVAEHICDTLFVGDARVRRVEVRIVKLAIAEQGESIGITLVRGRK